MKLTVIGSAYIGKSALVIQYLKSYFVTEYDPTIEDSYRQQVVIDKEICTLDILDTAGQEQYSVIRESYMREGEGFIIVYSVTDRNSFENVSNFREQIKKVKGSEAFPVIVVGNKTDLEHDRRVSFEEGLELAVNYGISFFEVSSFRGEGVDQMILDFVRKTKDHAFFKKRKWLEKKLLPRNVPKKGKRPFKPTIDKPQSLFVSDLKKILERSKIYDYSIICDEKGIQENEINTNNRIYLHKWILKKRVP
ncbi:ras-like protein [Anaeramoeba flamelloides]|uniref:Ras-like protein n=1 Tax=Anaeramoeba flamelloides TaxID=1746091 RepID=A0AAV7Y397_9EUKA|nr:ras-like protein [Anaeramoeba flamelloides]